MSVMKNQPTWTCDLIGSPCFVKANTKSEARTELKLLLRLRKARPRLPVGLKIRKAKAQA
jgi:hypothetical protein